MSLVMRLATRVGGLGEDLPVPEVRLAAERLRTATGLLGYVLAASAGSLRPVPTLGGATEHLDSASGALRVAQDRLTEYLTSIGFGGTGVPAENRDWRAALTDPGTGSSSTVDTKAPGPLADWWAARVGMLTSESVTPVGDPAGTGPELLRRTVDRALAGDRAGLGRELAGAGAATGLGLSALTPAVLDQLAAELTGHPAGPDDRPAIRDATRPLARDLLPGLAEPLLAALVERICRAPVPPIEAHPADSAVAGAVLVAALLRALGQDAGQLSREAYHPADRAPRPLVAARA